MGKKKIDFHCAVIGGGPGGLVSSIYLRRFQRKVVLFDYGRPRAAWIPRTHNLIGYDRGISGKMLLERLHRQVSKLGLEWIRAEARIERDGDTFHVRFGENEDAVRVNKVILATGIQDIDPTLDNLAGLRKMGLLRYCSICDGYEYRKQPIAVLAKDNLGFQKAFFLAQWTKDIRIIIPGDYDVPPVWEARFRKEKGIKVVPCKTLRLAPLENKEGLSIILNERRQIQVRAVYVELGSRVIDSGFKHLKRLRRSKDGFLITTTEQRTSIPGLFAVGDCVNLLGQISVAAGQAAVAATTIHNDLL